MLFPTVISLGYFSTAHILTIPICFVCFLLLSTLFVLTSCSCEHEWVNATCTTPVTCSKCGETAGDPLNHNWQEATCTTPKICSVCSVTEGAEVGHAWANATCTSPKTCSVCGAVDGSVGGHTWVNATCTEPKTCSVCNLTEDTVVGHTWVNATCTTPKTCSVCATIEGNELGHTWKNATCTTPKTCSTCGVTEGSSLGHAWTNATCTEPKTCYTCWITEGSALGHNDDGSGWCTTCWEQLYVVTSITANKTNLQLGETSQVIYFTMTGADTIVYDIDNTNVVYCEWGEWDGNTIPLTFHPVASGQTYVTVYPEGYDESITVNVAVSMNDYSFEEPSHTHYFIDSIVNPTCTSQGYTIHTCGCGYSYRDNYTAEIGHTEVIDAGKPATPQSTGLTEGSHCAVCGKVIVKQQVIPKDTSSLVSSTTFSIINDLSQEYSYVASQLYTRCKIEQYDYDVSYSYGDKINLKITLYLKKTEQGKANLDNLKLNYTLYRDGVAVKSSFITILNAEFGTLYETTINYTGTPGNYSIEFSSVRY